MLPAITLHQRNLDAIMHKTNQNFMHDYIIVSHWMGNVNEE